MCLDVLGEAELGVYLSLYILRVAGLGGMTMPRYPGRGGIGGFDRASQ